MGAVGSCPPLEIMASSIHPWRSRQGVDTLGGGPPMEFKVHVQTVVDVMIGAVQVFH